MMLRCGGVNGCSKYNGHGRLFLNLIGQCVSKFGHGNNHFAQCLGRFLGIISRHPPGGALPHFC